MTVPATRFQRTRIATGFALTMTHIVQLNGESSAGKRSEQFILNSEF